MENETKISSEAGKMKLKKILIGAGIAVVVIAAFTVALNSVNNNFSGSQLENSRNLSADSMPSPQGVGGSAVNLSSKGIPASSETTDTSSVQSSEITDKKIIKNGNLTFKVSNADNAAGDIATIAKNNGGEVFSSNFYENTSNVKSGTITIRVPVANFEKTFSEIKKVASLVVRESTSGQDVTEQYVDLQSRLKNKQEEEKAFADILARSGQIDDVLKVTRELARVRGEIEALQGQIKFMNSQTDMSVISVNLSEDDNITISDSWRPLQIAKDAINSLINKIQKFISFVIVLVITVIPIMALYLFLFFALYLIGKKIYRKIRKRKEGTSEIVK
jgi:hypothetical protein